jgi:two-component system sensor histidine kinase DegS
VTNIGRHAEASHASIILMTRPDGEISLIVEDNGRGFDPDAFESAPDKALGLLGIRERAALVGGDLTIDSQAGHGTTLRIRVAANGVSR